MKNVKKISIIMCLSISLLLFAVLMVLIITKNETLSILDNNIAQFLFNNRTRAFDYLFVIISYLGETITIVVLCAILLLLPSRKQIGVPVIIITIISLAINFVIKIIVARQRPENLFLTQDTLGYKMPDGYSFPSGHAQTANIFYFVLSYLILNRERKNWKKILLMSCATIFCFLMCIARLYLCVHFFTDVLCGLCIMISLFSAFVLLEEYGLKHMFYHHE